MEDLKTLTRIKKEINDTQIELGRNFYSRKTIDDLLNILFSTMVYELLNKGIKDINDRNSNNANLSYHSRD